jgi:hypothetical protein
MTAFGNLAEQFVRSAASAPLAFTTRPSGSNGRTPAPYLVNFYALDGSVELTAMMGDGPATLTGGVGGWQEEVRHGAAPVTWWDAPAAYRQSIPLMFYGSASQEGAIQALYRLARPGPHGRPPPAVMIAGQAIWRADIVWVIEGIDPGTKVRRRASDGQVTRHDFTVRLLQYGETKVVVERSPSRRAAGKGQQRTSAGRGVTTYRVRRGDTLPKIAARKEVYGDADQWKRLASANHIRDPRSLVVGSVLKVPRG